LLPEVVVNPEEIQAAYDERKDIVSQSSGRRTDIAFMDDLDQPTNSGGTDKGGDFKTVTGGLGTKTLRADTWTSPRSAPSSRTSSPR